MLRGDFYKKIDQAYFCQPTFSSRGRSFWTVMLFELEAAHAAWVQRKLETPWEGPDGQLCLDPLAKCWKRQQFTSLPVFKDL